MPAADLPGTQLVRVLDVLALGPFLVWAGAAKSGLPRPARAALAISGIATILFNGINLVRHARRLP